MRGIIPRRWIRQAGEAARRLRRYPAAALLRREIAPALRKQSAAHRTPYYDRLALSARRCTDPRPLQEVLRTLSAVDRALDPGTGSTGPLVSVIMPVRNRAGVVTEAIRSVLAQTHAPLELLICDDASADPTWSVLESFPDPRIRLFRLREHRGAASARNVCLANARGEFVAYLDSDNLWHPRFLELTVVAAFRHSPESPAAFASYFDLRLDGRGGAALKAAQIRSFDLEVQIEKPFIDLNSFAHRRELVSRYGGFDERLVRRQDYDLIVRYCWSHRPVHVDYALNLYQRAPHLDQITQLHGGDHSAPDIIREKIAGYRRDGVPAAVSSQPIGERW